MMQFAVFRPARLWRLFQSDAINVSRDATMIFVLIMSVVPAIALNIWRQDLNNLGQVNFGLADIARFIVPLALCLPGFLVGWVTGFLFLDDRDDGPLLALDITPIGKSGFLLYRLTITAVLAVAVTLLSIHLVAPDYGWMPSLVMCILVALQAMCVGFILPAIARNKVEGLALTKVLNIASIVPLLAAIPSPWRYVGGIIPTFWVGELLELSDQRYLSLPAATGLAIVIHLMAAFLLYRLNKARAG